MQQIKNFPYIPKEIPRHHILKRLGYHGRTTEITGDKMAEIDGWIQKAADIIELKGVCRRVDITLGDGLVSLNASGETIESASLCRLLEDSDQILMMGLTGGSAVVDEINSLQKEGRMTEAVVIDAAAGEIVDYGFEWLESLFTSELRREGRRLTRRRFSAGYGDMELSSQKDMYRQLELDKIGVDLTADFILLPEKSVTAVYGIIKSAN